MICQLKLMNGTVEKYKYIPWQLQPWSLNSLLLRVKVLLGSSLLQYCDYGFVLKRGSVSVLLIQVLVYTPYLVAMV